MRWSRLLTALLCGLAIAIILVARLAIGPADLYEKDQPKTLAYTADVLLHGRFALPRDVIYQPATKPPMYNWIAAGVMTLTRSWSELAMKSPSVLGAIGIAMSLMWLTRRHVVREHAIAVGLLAAAFFFTCGLDTRHASTIRLLYLARPDMLQAFFLTAAWACATLLVLPGDIAKRRSIALTACFWASVIGAMLTKGPLAIVAIVYVAFAAIVLGDWRRVLRLRLMVGLGAMGLCVGTWLYCAYRTDPAHVGEVMIGAEVLSRITTATPEGFRQPRWMTLVWFVTKGGVASVLAIACVVATLFAWRRTQPIARLASVWLVLLLIVFTLPSARRMDYILPAYAPAALLAAIALAAITSRLRLPLATAALLPLGMSVVLAHAQLTKFHESRQPLSDRAIAFTRAIESRVTDDQSLLVLVRGKHPLPTLLHRHQGSLLTRVDLERARFVVMPLSATSASPLLHSEPLPIGFDDITTRPLELLGLFDLSAASKPTLEEMAALQRSIGTWRVTENPYHAPGTVWRE